ncbi:MAG TPA: hypothetical protein VF622_12675 [Segetibacter sp.]|jgi:hypothetical protein
MKRIISFLSPFSSLFKVLPVVFLEMHVGMFCAERSNYHQIADVSDNSNQQGLHHLLSSAKR